MSQASVKRDLLKRYRQAWKNRQAMDAPPRLPHEVHFLPAALALQDAPVHRVRELTAAKKTAENQQNSVIAQTRRAMLDLQHESRLTAPVAGTVVSISSDATEDERLGLVYSARIQLKQDDIQVGENRIQLSSGMAIRAEVKTDKRKVIDYFLSSLKQYANESLDER